MPERLVPRQSLTPLGGFWKKSLSTGLTALVECFYFVPMQTENGDADQQDPPYRHHDRASR